MTIYITYWKIDNTSMKSLLNKKQKPHKKISNPIKINSKKRRFFLKKKTPKS